MNLRLPVIFAIVLFHLFNNINLRADALEEARIAVNEGDYKNGIRILTDAMASNSKLAQNVNYLYLLGICELEEGNLDKAEEYLNNAKSKGNGNAGLYLSKIAVKNYEFEKAGDLMAQYKKYKDKNRQPYDDEADIVEQELMIAENALSRVEKLVIIDSIAADREDFLSKINLSVSGGYVKAPQNVNEINFSKNVGESIYINEEGDLMIWAEPDSTGNKRLMIAEKFLDNKWDTPQPLTNIDGEFIYGDFPYLRVDGVTLYYSVEGDDSMGGKDIVVAKRDPISGKFLQPTNIGMPYNSPFNDYMFVIDEEKGIGWFVTDRNNIEDEVTIYPFIFNELRSNYNYDEENIASLAKVENYEATQEMVSKSQLKEFKDRLDEREEINNKDAEFRLPMGNGVTYTSFSDFKNRRGADAMRKYLAEEKELKLQEEKLKSLRLQYKNKPTKVLGKEINEKEKAVMVERETVRKLLSAVYEAERGGNGR